MLRTRYTKNQYDKDSEILIHYGLYEQFEASKGLVEELCVALLGSRQNANHWQEMLEQERSKPLWKVIRERVF